MSSTDQNPTSAPGEPRCAALGYGEPDRKSALDKANNLVVNGNFPGVLPVYQLNKRVPPKVKEELETAYGIKIVGPAVGSYHQHPKLAVEQAIAEDAAHQFIRRHTQGTVLDVFGNASRNERMNRANTWSCMPSKTPADVLRVANAPSAGPWCSHGPLACNCVVPDAVVLTQSLQYMTQPEIAALIMRSTKRFAVAVVHRFHGMTGTFHHKEMVWYRCGINTVKCKLDGGITEYTHDSLDWMDHPEYMQTDVQGRHVECTIVPTLLVNVGQTYVYLLTLQHPVDAVPTYVEERPWSVSVLDNSEHDPAVVYSIPRPSSSGAAPYSFDWYQLKLHTIRLLPGVVLITGEEQRFVILSTAIVQRTRTKFLLHPRNSTTLRQCHRFVLAQYDQVTNLPEDRRHSAVLATLLLVMSAGLAEDVATINEMNRHSQRLWAAHSSVIEMQPLPTTSTTDLAIGGLWAGLSALTIDKVAHTLSLPHIVVPKVGSLVAVKMTTVAATAALAPSVPLLLPIWAGCTAVLAGTYLVRKHDLLGSRHRNEAVKQWISTEPGEAPPPLATGGYQLDVAPSFGPTDRVKPRLRGASIDDRAEIGEVPVDIERDAKPKMQLLGCAFSATMPTYFASTAANEAIALQNRLGAKTFQPVEGMWALIGKLHRDHPFTKYIISQVSRKPIKVDEAQAQRYAAKFNRSQQMLLIDSFHEWEQTKTITKRDQKVKAFGKIEKAVKHVIVEEEIVPGPNDEGTPRGIIAMTPTLSAVFGVIVNQYSERERYALVHALELYGSVSPICPQGVSAEIRGEWLSAWIEILGGEENCVFMDADMRMYDGSHSRDTFREAHNTTLNQCAITPPEARAALMTKRELRGRSHGGVTFKIKNKMGSGFSDTTLTGTKVNEMGTVSALEAPAGSTQPVEPKMLGREYAIAPNGDDIFGVLSRAWFESKFDCMGIAYDRAEAHYVEYWKSLGFEVVPHFRRHLWEVDFLSKLWYPCEGTYILGGKIGRVFSRVGWFLDCKDEMTIRGAAISAFQDNAHVPFLREYFEHVIKLTKGMKVSGRPAEHSVHTTRAHMYDEDTLAFVENRYGLTHKDLEDFVGLLQTVTRLPAVISWPHLERCVAIDA